mmetsp:Transcript_6448/g.15788  ORF Transcript_6448/g.15788 Transcript_6448/m.15788 type:complete len:235 (-) Transcript_6448:93-797(-)
MNPSYDTHNALTIAPIRITFLFSHHTHNHRLLHICRFLTLDDNTVHGLCSHLHEHCLSRPVPALSSYALCAAPHHLQLAQEGALQPRAPILPPHNPPAPSPLLGRPHARRHVPLIQRVSEHGRYHKARVIVLCAHLTETSPALSVCLVHQSECLHQRHKRLLLFRFQVLPQRRPQKPAAQPALLLKLHKLLPPAAIELVAQLPHLVVEVIVCALVDDVFDGVNDPPRPRKHNLL